MIDYQPILMPHFKVKEKKANCGFDLCLPHQVEKSSRANMECQCHSSLEPPQTLARWLAHSVLLGNC